MGNGGGQPIRQARRRGRKKYFFPLPVLSVLLVVTALAAPGVLHATFTIYDDGLLRIDARVQQLARRSATAGTLFGILSVRNDHPFGILVGPGSFVQIYSGDWDGTDFNVDMDQVVVTFFITRRGAQLFVPAGAKVTTQFFASISGDTSALATTTDFVLVGNLYWKEVYPNGDLVPLSMEGIEQLCVDPYDAMVLMGGTGDDACGPFPP